MSRGTQETREELLEELARELRQFNGLGAALYRAAAGRIGMTVTDMQVIDILGITGSTVAGRLADLTGLTTGAITGMLNRLEEAGFVRRERDPSDGRRVIVSLAPDKDDLRTVSTAFDSFGKAWEELVAGYDDAQVAFLVDVLKRGNAVSRAEIARLREAPAGEGGISSAPLVDVESGRLVVASMFSRVTLRASEAMAELYQARFEGTTPDVKAKDGVVTVRYPRRLLIMGGSQGAAEVALSKAIPWQIVVQGGAMEVIAELGGLDLAGLEVKGGVSTIRLDLPAPSGEVPIRISGGASSITVRRPRGVAARVHLKGWASHFVFDEQTFGDLGSDVRLQSHGFDASAPYYDIEVKSSASSVTIVTI
ncbi:MAG TPA: MarR family transcriptional regulator [Ktedonobacterales bacterium]